MYLFYSPRYLEHDAGAFHPECPERLTSIKKYLEGKIEFTLKEPSKIEEKELLLVHTKEYLDKLKELSEKQSSFPDNKFNSNTYEIAKLAVGGAVGAALSSKEQFSFALIRPPGHHAGISSFAGFCYLNNIAIATRVAQKEKIAKKVLIIDIDVHHGNGSQEIFYNDDSLFYLSLHQDPRTIFPGTGFEEENNEHILNMPLVPGTKDPEYLEKLKIGIEKAKKFSPDLIGISIGFDTFYEEGLANIKIENSKTYFKIGNMIKKSFDCPIFGVLEGGYYLPKLGENAYNLLAGLM